VTRQTIAVEHVRIESAKSFADVRAALERTLPQLDHDRSPDTHHSGFFAARLD